MSFTPSADAAIKNADRGPQSRMRRIRLWQWVVIVVFAALALDIYLEVVNIRKSRRFHEPTLAEEQALERELEEFVKEKKVLARRELELQREFDEGFKRLEKRFQNSQQSRGSESGRDN